MLAEQLVGEARERRSTQHGRAASALVDGASALRVPGRRRGDRAARPPTSATPDHLLVVGLVARLRGRLARALRVRRRLRRRPSSSSSSRCCCSRRSTRAAAGRASAAVLAHAARTSRAAAGTATAGSRPPRRLLVLRRPGAGPRRARPRDRRARPRRRLPARVRRPARRATSPGPSPATGSLHACRSPRCSSDFARRPPASTRSSRRSPSSSRSRPSTSRSCLLAIAPLVWLLDDLLARRRERYAAALELHRAYRGTVMLLSDVVEFEDEYTAEHSPLGRRPGPRRGRRARHRPARAPGARVRRAAARRRQDRDPQGDPEQAGHARPTSEFEVMKTHTIEGQFMLDRVGGLLGARRRDRALVPRALGRQGLPRRPARRGDPAAPPASSSSATPTTR